MIKTKKIAPICISTYTRLEHLRKTIGALQNNQLADHSRLFIFSDAARPGDEHKVELVRSYLETIEGFLSLHIIKRKTNNRVFNNRDGLRQVMAEHGHFIFLEEDILTAPGFLTFMNEALEYYENDKNVLSITGYCPPINISDRYRKDYFTLKRFSGWGFASWREKFELDRIKPAQKDLAEFFINRDDIRRFSDNGPDMLPMLRRVAAQEIDALDVNLMFYQFKHGLCTIYPRKSLTQNIGHDGTGEHCVKTSRFQNESLWNKTEGFSFQPDIEPDPEIVKAHYNFRNYSSFRNRITRFFRGR